MDNKQAVTVVAQALEIANKAGAYALKDAELINGALGVLVRLVEAVDGPLNAETVEQEKPVAKTTGKTKKVKA